MAEPGSSMGLFVQVPQDERWVTEVFGKYHRTLGPGLCLTIPVIEKLRAKQSIRELVRTIEVTGTITHDGIIIKSIRIEILTRLDETDPTSAYEVTYALQDGIEKALDGLVDASVREEAGKLEFEHLYNDLNGFKDRVAAAMSSHLGRWGERLMRFNIAEVIPPDDIATLLAAPFKAKQEGEAAVITAQKANEVKVATATAEATTITTLAAANRQKAIAEAEAAAESRTKEAESKARVLQVLIERCGDVQTAISYLFGEEQIEAVRALGSGKGTIILPAGADGVGALFGMVKALTGHKNEGDDGRVATH